MGDVCCELADKMKLSKLVGRAFIRFLLNRVCFQTAVGEHKKHSGLQHVSEFFDCCIGGVKFPVAGALLSLSWS